MDINKTTQQQSDYPSTTPTGTNNSTDISNSKRRVPDNAIKKQIVGSNPQHGVHRLLNQSQIETVDSVKPRQAGAQGFCEQNPRFHTGRSILALPSTQQRCPENMMAHTTTPHQPPATPDEANPAEVSTKFLGSQYFYFQNLLDKQDIIQSELPDFLMAAKFKDHKLFRGITSDSFNCSLLQTALQNNRTTAVTTLVNTFQLFNPESSALYHLYCDTDFDSESFRRLLDYANKESNNLEPELLWPEPLQDQVINLLCWLGKNKDLRDLWDVDSPYVRRTGINRLELLFSKITCLFAKTSQLNKGIPFLSDLLDVTVYPSGDIIKNKNNRFLEAPELPLITAVLHFRFTDCILHFHNQFKNTLLWVCHRLGNTPMMKILLDCGAEVSADQLFGRDTSFTSQKIFMLAVERGNEDLARQINEKGPIEFPVLLGLTNSGWWDKGAVKKSVIANDLVKNFFRCVLQEELETEPSLESDWAFQYCRTLANEEIIDTLIQTFREPPDDIWATIKNRLIVVEGFGNINNAEQLAQWLNKIPPGNLDQIMHKGETLLGKALHNGNHKVIELLIRHGAFRINQQGDTVFEWFLDQIREPNKPTELFNCVVNALMTHHPQKGKELLNQPVAEGPPLLYWAIKHHCIEIIDTLLTHGASPDLDIGHTTAFHSLAAEANHIGNERVLEIYHNMVKALNNNDKQSGAQPLNFYLDKPDSNKGQTPLAYAVLNKQIMLVECLAKKTTNFNSIPQFLIQKYRLKCLDKI